MPLTRGNMSPMRCAAKRSTVLLRKRQHMQQQEQLQVASAIERLQQEQHFAAAAAAASMADRKRRRCDASDYEDDCGDARDTKRSHKTVRDELCELKTSVHHVQRQVATAARHIQELRALVHGFVEQRRASEAPSSAVCA